MLARSSTEQRLARTASRVLDAFTLPERIVREDDVAFARQVRDQLLIAWPGLAIHRVTQRRKNPWAASCSSRHIEVRRDVESRPTLERHFLDAIARPLDDARHARIEGRAIERSSQHLPELHSHHLLPVEDFLPRGDRVDDALAPLARIVRKADQVSLEIAGIIRKPRALDVQLHARRARVTAARGRLFERTDRTAEARRGGKGSGGFEEPAARICHEMHSAAILVREMLRVNAWSVRSTFALRATADNLRVRVACQP